MLESENGYIFRLTPKVDGAIRPFSFEVYEENSADSERAMILKIKDNLFSHHNEMYIMRGVPEGRPMSKHILGARSICRLVNFPFKTLDEIGHETKTKLTRLRGAEVGEISGYGTKGHKVKLSYELEDIGIPLSAASYLMYSTG